VSKRLFRSVLAAALAIRILLILTSFGSTDALLLMGFVRLVEHVGIARAYSFARFFNHPPLAAFVWIAADRLGSLIHLEFTDVFRLFQVVADIASAALLWRMSKSREVVAFFFASPAAIFLSGFHCNGDPTMTALLLAAICLQSGLLLGTAAGIKITPIPLAPFFLIGMGWRRRFVFALAFGAVLALIFVPVAIKGGPVVLHNIFGYRGSGFEWGFCGMGFLTGSARFAQWYSQYGHYVVIVALVGLWIGYRAPLPAMIGTALLAMNFFSPGFGVQYLVWPLPFFLFAVPRKLAYALNAALSIFLFCTYTIWAGGFPWWFADAAHHPHRIAVALLALPLWLLYGFAIVAALRNGPRQLGPEKLAEG